jgi:hypothetical protein
MRPGKSNSATGIVSFASLRLAALAIAAAFLCVPLPEAEASSPTSGTLSPTSSLPVTWTGTAVGGSGEAGCVEGVTCDFYTLNLSGSPSDWVGKVVRVRISWLLNPTDYDMYIHKDSASGPEVTNSASSIGSTTQEIAELDPATTGTGAYVVRVVYYAATAADQYQGSATVGAPTASLTAKGQTPSFANYLSPAGIGDDAGEPTIGANWATGNVMFIAILETLRVTFDDSTSPASATWQNVSAPQTSLDSFDPILFTDGDVGPTRTNRTFVSQLLPSKISLMAFTDDDGATWTPSQGAGINSGVDHQTVGGGPYAKNADGGLKGGALQRPGPDGQTYPHAVYYASQDVGLAQIARSDDGGFTFGVAVPMWDITKCAGLHGQIKVAPDGTVYVPNPNCNGQQGLAVSEDNGMTWEIRILPDSTSSVSDPSVGVGTDGTLYYGYADAGDSTPKVAVSRDKGRTWNSIRNVGASQGIQNVAFPAVVAGDGDRAAIFFLGSKTGGAAGVGEDLGAFDGVWHGYIAMTYDRGNSWVTVNATPGDPVQRGPICGQGTLCADGSRELLDFNDATVDSRGRVLAAYADGCISQQCIQGVDRGGPTDDPLGLETGGPDGRVDGYDNDMEDKAAIIRQSGGKGLFAAEKKKR